MSTVTIEELGRDVAAWLARVQEGEWVVVMEGERAVAEIRPASAPSVAEAEGLTRLDRTAFTVCASFAEAEQQDRDYWHSRTPAERLTALELTRRMVYGDAATARLQRLLEVTERPSR